MGVLYTVGCMFALFASYCDLKILTQNCNEIAVRATNRNQS